jgi:succinyl-diaminopimelate desuccinylase
MTTKDKIDRLVEGYRDVMIRDIVRLISYKSLTGLREENTAALDFVLRRAEDFGMRTKWTKDKDVGIVEMEACGNPGEKQTVGILVHVDVVGIGDAEKWTSPPFEAAVSDTRITGRGATDDKGPVFMSLYAMRAIKELGIVPACDIQLIIGTSEEGEWIDIDHFKEQYPAPDFGFSPDAGFPIYNEESGYVDVVLTFPDTGTIETLSAGDSPNTIPSKALIRLTGGEDAVYDGRAAHSATPELGKNAILRLCRSFAPIQSLGFCRFITDRFTDEEQFVVDRNLSKGKTTAAPTILRKTENGIELNINMRQAFGVTRERLEADYTKYGTDYGFTFKIIGYKDPLFVNPDQPFIRILNDAYESYGFTGGMAATGGTTYAKSMKNFVSFGPLIPGEDEDSAHMENEFIRIETLLTGTKIYASALAAR